MGGEHHRLRPISSVLTAALAAIALVAPGTVQAGPDGDAVLSPAGFLIVDRPSPVLGTDGRMHLAYEILVTNQSSLDLTPASLRARTRGKPIGAALKGADFAPAMRINGGVDGAAIPAGGSATIFADATYDPDRRTPRRLAHRIVLDGAPPLHPDDVQRFAFHGVPTPVSARKAVEVRPPLRGSGWVVGNGCCSPPNAHRGATLSIDGTVHVPERFAIDFVQIDDRNRLFDGPIDENESYFSYGHRIHSATAGRVVRTQDGLPEQVPGSLPEGETVQTAGGNYVVVAMGRGRYAFYAHMQPGSLRVGVGDRVKPGEVIGLLGNTGNTDAAHLHFHVMDSASPLQSNGLPFVFSRMRGQGLITDPAVLPTGAPVTIDRAAFAGARRGEMPLNDQVVGFPRNGR
jgi:hypothetical protein